MLNKCNYCKSAVPAEHFDEARIIVSRSKKQDIKGRDILLIITAYAETYSCNQCKSRWDKWMKKHISGGGLVLSKGSPEFGEFINEYKDICDKLKIDDDLNSKSVCFSGRKRDKVWNVDNYFVPAPVSVSAKKKKVPKLKKVRQRMIKRMTLRLVMRFTMHTRDGNQLNMMNLWHG